MKSMKFNTEKIKIAILLVCSVGVLSAQKKQQTIELVGQQIQLYVEFGEFEEDVTVVEVSNGTCADCYAVKIQKNSDKSLFTVSVNDNGVQWVANPMDGWVS